MRVRVVLVMLLGAALAHAEVVSNYQAITGHIADRAMEAALYKEPARWNKVWMKIKCHIADDGRILDVKITSLVRNRWAEDTVRRTLLSLRFPPVPKEILVQAGHNGVYTQSELKISK
jgi:hypothetical protein